MEVRGNFILVTPADDTKPAFWIRSQDVVGVSHSAHGPTTLFRHATVPLEVLDGEEEVLLALADADGRVMLLEPVGSASGDID